MNRKILRSSRYACLSVVLLLGACSKDEKPKEITSEQKVKAVAWLAVADESDGTKDKIISQCATCALRMAGDAANALEFEGYAMHFCSKHCRDLFAKDPIDIIAKN